MKTDHYLKSLAIKLVCILAPIAPCSAALIYQSATLGPTGAPTGWSINESQFLGARFELTLPTNITGVGGEIGGEFDSEEVADIFGVIVRLPSDSALPSGNPFTGVDVLASGVFSVSGPTQDHIFPLSASLLPGSYALIFGEGYFGDSPDTQKAFMAADQIDSPDASYFNGAPSYWSDGGFRSARFTVYGDVVGDVAPVPEPSGILFGAFSLIAGISQRVRSNAQRR